MLFEGRDGAAATPVSLAQGWLRRIRADGYLCSAGSWTEHIHLDGRHMVRKRHGAFARWHAGTHPLLGELRSVEQRPELEIGVALRERRLELRSERQRRSKRELDFRHLVRERQSRGRPYHRAVQWRLDGGEG